MTEDLVKRLHKAVAQFYGTHPCGLLAEAAGRIEELEDKTDNMNKYIDDLRASLKVLSSNCDCWGNAESRKKASNLIEGKNEQEH